MSYQIKSTPYFRRMFNNSKKNGQLQRLREEYERIQEFNDRTIELKMRQVRLKRLFREIEDIKESGAHTSSPAAGRGHSREAGGIALPVTPTQERQRLETLARAKELGKEMSRRNAELLEGGAASSLRNEVRMTVKMRAAANARREALERRERAAKRISYGNAQSKSNMQRLGQRRHRRQDGHEEDESQATLVSTAPPQQRTDEEKRVMLQQRLSYGNARSSSNMMRCHAAAAARAVAALPDVPEPACSSDTAAPASAQLKQHRNNPYADAVLSDQYVDPPTATNEEPTPASELRRTVSDATCSNGKAARLPTALQQQETDDEPSCSATDRWRQISHTLPWFKAFEGGNGRRANSMSALPCTSSYDDVDSTTHAASTTDSTETTLGPRPAAAHSPCQDMWQHAHEDSDDAVNGPPQMSEQWSRWSTQHSTGIHEMHSA